MIVVAITLIIPAIVSVPDALFASEQVPPLSASVITILGPSFEVVVEVVLSTSPVAEQFE